MSKYILLMLLLVSSAYAVNYLPFAGYGAKIGGTPVNGSLNVTVYSDAACKIPIYNKVYANAVLNGRWYVLLGNNTPESDLDLTLGEYYWRSYSIDAGSGYQNYNDSYCVRFQAVFGSVNATAGNGTGNISGSGIVGSIPWFTSASTISSDVYLFYDNNTGTLSSLYFAGNLDWPYLTNVPGICYSNGSGCPASSNSITGSGTGGYLAEWYNGSALNNSPLYDDGNSINFSGRNITGVDTLYAHNISGYSPLGINTNVIVSGNVTANDMYLTTTKCPAETVLTTDNATGLAKCVSVDFSWLNGTLPFNYSQYFDQYLNTSDNVTFTNVHLNGALNGSGGAYGSFMPDNYFSVNGTNGSGGFIIGVDGKPVWDILTYPGENGKFFYMGYNHRSGDIAFTVAESGRIGVNKQTNILNPDSGYTAGTGAGADDMTVGGAYTGDTEMQFEIVAQNGSVFQYRTNKGNLGWGAYSANISMATTPITLTDGVTVVWANETGHGTNATWYFTAFSQIPAATFSINPTAFFKAYVYTGSTYRDITFEAGTSAGNPRTLFANTSQYFYVSRPVQYRTTYFYLATYGVGVNLKAEYWNGSAWATIGAAQSWLDHTYNLTQSGAVSWDTSLLSNWTTSTINGEDGYWMRYSTTTAMTTAPQIYAATPQGVNRLEVYQSPFDTIPVFSVTPQGSGVFSNNIYVGYGASTTNSLSTATTAAGMFLPKKYIAIDSTDNDDAGFVIGHEGLPMWDISTFVNEEGRYLHVGINYRTAETAFLLAETGRGAFFKPSNILQYHTTFNGTGKNDAYPSGTYTGTYYDTFQVKAINGSIFQWRVNIDNRGFGAWSSNITMNGSAQFLYKGIHFTFPSPGGYTANDVWEFNAFSQNPHATYTINPSQYIEVLVYNGTNYTDLTYEASTSTGTPFAVLNRTNSYIYGGRNVPTLSTYANLQTVGAGITLVTEFWNGTGWQQLGAAQNYFDGTNNLTKSGPITWDDSAMANWMTNVSVEDYNSTSGIYWLRWSTTTNATQVPLAQSWSPQGFSRFEVFQNALDVTPAFSIGANGDLVTTGTLQAQGFYGELYNVTTGGTLTLTLQSTFYNVTGWTAGELAGWTVTPENVLVCTTPGLYQVAYRTAGQVNAANDLTWQMVVNTASEPKSVLTVRYSNGQSQQISQVFLKRFAQGDKVYLQLANPSSAGKVFTFDSKAIIITRLGS